MWDCNLIRNYAFDISGMYCYFIIEPYSQYSDDQKLIHFMFVL